MLWLQFKGMNDGERVKDERGDHPSTARHCWACCGCAFLGNCEGRNANRGWSVKRWEKDGLPWQPWLLICQTSWNWHKTREGKERDRQTDRRRGKAGGPDEVGGLERCQKFWHQDSNEQEGWSERTVNKSLQGQFLTYSSHWLRWLLGKPEGSKMHAAQWKSAYILFSLWFQLFPCKLLMRSQHPKLQFCHKLILLHCLGSEVKMPPACAEICEHVFNEKDFCGILRKIDFVRLNVCAEGISSCFENAL